MEHQSTEALLDERNSTHGSFIVNSRVGQSLKDVIRRELSYRDLPLIHREALDFIFSKIGRIMAGQYDYNDHWHDIAGYAKLPEKFNHGKEEAQGANTGGLYYSAGTTTNKGSTMGGGGVQRL